MRNVLFWGLTLGLLLSVTVLPGAGQIRTEIDSHGSSIVLTIWQAESEPVATVLLVPGWGGGPTDVLGTGQSLSANGMSAVVLTPRGWHESEGTASFANALDDISATLDWIRASNRRDLNSSNVVLGGYSWGGGISLAYAALDPSIRRVFSVAGTDHGQFIRQYISDPDFATTIREVLTASAVPQGPIRFGVESTLQELMEGQAVYGLLENAQRLADRSVLLVGGWEDVNVTVEATLLPLYRALRAAGGEDVTFRTYHADHSFAPVRTDLQADLLQWIQKH